MTTQIPRPTPDFLLWAHKLQREYTSLVGRINAIEATPKDRAITVTTENIKNIESRLEKLETGSLRQKHHQESIARLEQRIALLEERLDRLSRLEDGLKKDRAEWEDHTNELRTIGARMNFIDKEVSDQSLETKSLTVKLDGIEHKFPSWEQKLHEMETAIDDQEERFVGLDSKVAFLNTKLDQEESNGVETDRNLQQLWVVFEKAKVGITLANSETKFHLEQLYNSHDALEVALQSVQAATISNHSMKTPNYETQVNLERRWDMEYAALSGMSTQPRQPPYSNLPCSEDFQSQDSNLTIELGGSRRKRRRLGSRNTEVRWYATQHGQSVDLMRQAEANVVRAGSTQSQTDIVHDSVEEFVENTDSTSKVVFQRNLAATPEPGPARTNMSTLDPNQDSMFTQDIQLDGEPDTQPALPSVEMPEVPVRTQIMVPSPRPRKKANRKVPRTFKSPDLGVECLVHDPRVVKSLASGSRMTRSQTQDLSQQGPPPIWKKTTSANTGARRFSKGPQNSEDQFASVKEDDGVFAKRTRNDPGQSHICA